MVILKRIIIEWKACCLTVSGNFIGRVEPAVSTWRCADVQVEVDVVSEPVAALFVAYEYRLLPVLHPFTLTAGKTEKATRRRGTDEKGSTIHHSVGNGFPLFFSNDEVRQRRREMDTGSPSDHNSFCCAGATPVHSSSCPNNSAEKGGNGAPTS